LTIIESYRMGDAMARIEEERRQKIERVGVDESSAKW
jgi:hypothetical protein